MPHPLYLSFFVALFLSFSCAPSFRAPTRAYVRIPSRAVADVDDLAVVVDTCMTMDRLKDYISVADSRAIESYMASAASSYLENIGYTASTRCAPFVGCFKASGETFHVKQERKDKAQDINPPFFTESGAPEDAAWQKTLAKVIRESLADVMQDQKPPADVFRANQEIRADLKLLQEHFQKRYVLIVVGNGVSVPALTSFTQKMVTGMATGILTGGLLVMTISDVTYLETYAIIIDLSKGEMLWSNSLRLQGGKVCSEDYYSTWNGKLHTYVGWVYNVLFYVPVRTSALIEAAQNGENERLKWMVLTDPNLDGGDAKGMMALHWACQNGHLKTVELLVKKGARVNCQDAEGDTPLHYAVRTNQPKMVTALLKKKASVHIKNAKGQSPLEVASSLQNKRITKMLQKRAKG